MILHLASFITSDERGKKQDYTSCRNLEILTKSITFILPRVIYYYYENNNALLQFFFSFLFLLFFFKKKISIFFTGLKKSFVI